MSLCLFTHPFIDAYCIDDFGLYGYYSCSLIFLGAPFLVFTFVVPCYIFNCGKHIGKDNSRFRLRSCPMVSVPVLMFIYLNTIYETVVASAFLDKLNLTYSVIQFQVIPVVSLLKIGRRWSLELISAKFSSGVYVGFY